MKAWFAIAADTAFRCAVGTYCFTAVHGTPSAVSSCRSSSGRPNVGGGGGFAGAGAAASAPGGRTDWSPNDDGYVISFRGRNRLSASCMSFAFRYRSSGIFERALSTTSASAGGIVGSTSASERCHTVKIFTSRAL